MLLLRLIRNKYITWKSYFNANKNKISNNIENQYFLLDAISLQKVYLSFTHLMPCNLQFS